MDSHNTSFDKVNLKHPPMSNTQMKWSYKNNEDLHTFGANSKWEHGFDDSDGVGTMSESGVSVDQMGVSQSRMGWD